MSRGCDKDLTLGHGIARDETQFLGKERMRTRLTKTDSVRSFRFMICMRISIV